MSSLLNDDSSQDTDDLKRIVLPVLLGGKTQACACDWELVVLSSI